MQDIEELCKVTKECNEELERLNKNVALLNEFVANGKCLMLGTKEVAQLCGVSEATAREFMNSKEVQSRLFDYGQGKKISFFNFLKIRGIGGA